VENHTKNGLKNRRTYLCMLILKGYRVDVQNNVLLSSEKRTSVLQKYVVPAFLKFLYLHLPNIYVLYDFIKTCTHLRIYVPCFNEIPDLNTILTWNHSKYICATTLNKNLSSVKDIFETNLGINVEREWCKEGNMRGPPQSGVVMYG